MKGFVFWLQFHWISILGFQLAITLVGLPDIGLDNGLAPNMRQAIIWTNADAIHWNIFPAPGGDYWTIEADWRINESVN